MKKEDEMNQSGDVDKIAAIFAQSKAREELKHLLGPTGGETEIFRDQYWPLYQKYWQEKVDELQK